MIECFESIEKHTGPELFSLIAHDKMNAECKQAVLNESMRLKPADQAQNMFIRNRLPVFQVFGSSDKQNTSAVDCALLTTPARTHTTKIGFQRFARHA
jgi:hypothetical protein